MDARTDKGGRRLAVPAATTVALVLIFLALLGIWDEIRFQGCITRQDRIDASPALRAGPHDLKCSRVPFFH